MVREILDNEAEQGLNALTQAGPLTIQRRCSSCGLEWESAHDGEACPLRELEITFLFSDWFMGFSEATSSWRSMV